MMIRFTTKYSRR